MDGPSGAPGEQPAVDADPADVTGVRAPADGLRCWFRPTRAQLLAGLLLGLLGFSLVVQARQTQVEGLQSLRQSDLVRILDTVSQRAERLEDEARSLEATRDELRTGTDRAAAAEQVARERLDVLGVLAGTLPAQGPGITLTVLDPRGQVGSSLLLDTVQELRDAGAEALQIGGAGGGGPVRVVADTYLVDGDEGGIVVDGSRLAPPYSVVVIGDPQTLASALDIPGGVLETLRQAGGEGRVVQAPRVTVSALRPVETPQYARPAPARGS